MSLANYVWARTKLPATAGTPAAGRSAPETAEAPSATAASAKSPTAKSASSHYHSTNHGTHPPTASTSPAAAASEQVRNQREEKKQKYYRGDWSGSVSSLASARRGGRRKRCRGTELHSAILGDHIRDATRYQKHRSVVISVAQIWNRLAQEAT